MPQADQERPDRRGRRKRISPRGATKRSRLVAAVVGVAMRWRLTARSFWPRPPRCVRPEPTALTTRGDGDARTILRLRRTEQRVPPSDLDLTLFLGPTYNSIEFLNIMKISILSREAK